MKKIIQTKLKEIEAKEGIKILHCVESGSRAWGFASPDSDYDVRFIYVRPEEFYLRLDKTRDVIEWQADDILDINGWDLQKALTLLHRSNPTLFEWNASPIVYHSTKEWEGVSAVIRRYFVSKAGLYHYLSTAKSNYREYLKGERVRLKKYFYVLRPLLCCRWILAEGGPAPMEFHRLVEAQLESKLQGELWSLVEQKIKSPEITEGPRVDAINAYIEASIPQLEEAIAALPSPKERGWEELNELFCSLVG